MKDQNKLDKKLQAKIMRPNIVKSGATAAAAFTIVPRHVLGGPNYTPPSNKLNIACIGVGGQGANDIFNLASENIVALCDVDDKRGHEIFGTGRPGAYTRYPKAPKYRDFRKMLEKEDKNIDAVTVAIPDNTHAVAAKMAIKMGKHVYCEKPLTHTIYEARKLTQAAREAKVATQMGNHGQAAESVRLLCEFIWDGVIGPVRKVHVWTDRAGIRRTHGIGRPTGAPPVPSNLDWDLWLGPAPNRPYHPSYLPGMWRAWWDFGTGALGDIGCHRFAPIFRALKLKYPTSVCARSTSHFMAVPGRNRIVNSETYPVGSIVRYQFPARGDMPPVKLIWYDGGLMPERPEELGPGRPMRDNGMLLVGDKGKLLDGRLIPESKMKEYKRPPKTLPRSIGHYEEWIEACKGGQPAGSNFDIAGPLTEVVLLGNLSVRTGKKLNWDGTNMVVTNGSEANEYIHRQYRKGWTLV